MIPDFQTLLDQCPVFSSQAAKRPFSIPQAMLAAGIHANSMNLLRRFASPVRNSKKDHPRSLGCPVALCPPRSHGCHVRSSIVMPMLHELCVQCLISAKASILRIPRGSKGQGQPSSNSANDARFFSLMKWNQR